MVLTVEEGIANLIVDCNGGKLRLLVIQQRGASKSAWRQRTLLERADPWAVAQWMSGTWSGRDMEVEQFRQRQNICQAWTLGGIRG